MPPPRGGFQRTLCLCHFKPRFLSFQGEPGECSCTSRGEAIFSGMPVSGQSCFPAFPTGGEVWILASPGASGREPLPGFVFQPAPFPCNSVLGVGVVCNLSPSFATPTPTQGAPGLWMGSSSQPGPQVCVACLLCLASCRGFPALTLLPSTVAGSSLPPLILSSLPQGPPGVPGPPGPPGMPGLQVKG